MIYTAHVPSPLGLLLLSAKEDALIGLWLPGQKYYGAGLPEKTAEDADYAPLRAAALWLEAYFAGKNPETRSLRLSPHGSEYQRLIWAMLSEIPYGATVTYGALAAEAEMRLGRRTSARAVGAAVGRNPISVIIPCHRVIGSDGSLTGYAGGLDKKEWLLRHEGAI